MKKIVALAAAAVMITALVATATRAYFTAQGKADNVITSGSVSMKLHDETGDKVPFPKEGISGVVPGDIIDKCVYIENDGDNPLYARIKLEKAITLSNGEKVDDLEEIVLDINQDDWTYNSEDGYYYYNKALEPGDSTPPLFTKVTFSTDMGNEYQNARIDINISAQAVQSQNNTDSPLTATGWPAE